MDRDPRRSGIDRNGETRCGTNRHPESGEFQLSGPNQGSLLGFGRTLNEPYQEFVESLRCVLVDIASDAPSPEDFRREARDSVSAGDGYGFRRTDWMNDDVSSRRSSDFSTSSRLGLAA